MTDEAKLVGGKPGDRSSTRSGAGTTAGLAATTPAAEPQASPATSLAADMTFAMMNGFTRLFPGIGHTDTFDYPALSTAYRRTVDALFAASRFGIQGAELAASREMAIFQASTNDLGEAIRALISVDTPLDRAAPYVERSRPAYERTVTGTRELSDLIRNNQRQALDLLHRGALDTMSEIEKSFEKNGRRLADG